MTEAGFKSGFFDFVYASHVLEHIENVDQAIREIYRVLNSRGRALLDVPVYGSNTVKLVERDHDGHLWHPGTDDWFKRYEKAGFDVDFFPSQRVHRRYGVGSRSPVTICQKVS
jgi:SAM-dependent methyltransferase